MTSLRPAATQRGTFATGRFDPLAKLSMNDRRLRSRDGPSQRILFSNWSRAEALWVSTLSGACVLCVLVRHCQG
jgi:hypothetical protein